VFSFLSPYKTLGFDLEFGIRSSLATLEYRIRVVEPTPLVCEQVVRTVDDENSRVAPGTKFCTRVLAVLQGASLNAVPMPVLVHYLVVLTGLKSS
jgi:hypothetical protein